MMTVDRSFVAENRAATERLRALAGQRSEAELQRPLGPHWTVAIALAHIAFWDRRALLALDLTERDNAVNWPALDIFVNDLSLPVWASLPPRTAANMAVEAAAALDARLEAFPPALLEQLYAISPRLVVRALHRNEHLDEIDAALAESAPRPAAATAADPSFADLNRAATQRLRAFAARLADDDLRRPVGQHWTVAVLLAHLAFTDGRALWALDATQRARRAVNPDYGVFVNDILLPAWSAIPPRQAANLAIETAEAVDARLEAYPPELLAMLHAEYPRYIFRARHRNEHLDEAEAALKGKDEG
jgi:uncharacterized damage-inducible protein DinB